MMEKITLDQSISFTTIYSSIKVFISNINTIIGQMRLKQRLKHQTDMIKSISIDSQFLTNCISHCAMHQLGQTINNKQQYNFAESAEKIRQKYFQMSVKGFWKKQFQFQQGLVCLTKIISEFYNEAFNNVRVDKKLQSEIFIVLIYTIIGVKVGLASFLIIQKKYLRPKAQKTKKKDSSTKSRLTLRLKKVSSRQRTSVVSINKYTSINSSLFNQSAVFLQKEPIEQFKTTLRQDLYVNPLPAIKRQRKQLDTFILQNAKQTNKNFLDQNPLVVNDNKIYNRPFMSNQTSLSLNSQIVKRQVSIAYPNKPFKIKYRNPFYSSHIVVFKNDLKNDSVKDMENKIPKQKLQRGKLDSKQWQKTIKTIKQKMLIQQQNQRLTKRLQKENRKKYRQKKRQFFEFQQDRSKRVNQSTLYQQQTNNQSQEYEYKNSLPSSLHKISKKQQNSLNLSMNLKNKDQLSQLSAWNTATLSLVQNTINALSQSKYLTKRSSIDKDKQRKQGQHSFVRLDEGIKNFQDIIPSQNINYFENCKKSFDYKQLKQDKKQFDHQTRLRHYRMQYTMFMLPSMRSKINLML